MKKITVMLIAVLLLCVPCMTAFAEAPEQKGATISTTVPATFNITFISNGGRIEGGGHNLEGTEAFDRRSVHTFHIIPDEGKVIDKVLYGGEDVTSQVKDGYFTTPALTTDMTLEVIYKDASTSSEPTSEPDSNLDTSTSQISPGSDTAKTGDTTTTAAFAVIAVSAVFIIVLAKSRRKEKNGD